MTVTERPQLEQLWADPDGFEWCVADRHGNGERWLYRPEMSGGTITRDEYRAARVNRTGYGPQGWRQIPRALTGWELVLYADDDPRNEQEPVR